MLSSSVYYQDDKIRRRSDWSKWIPFSGTTSTASPSSASMNGSMGERNPSEFPNNGVYSEDPKKHRDSQGVRSNKDNISTEAKGTEEHLSQDVLSCSLNKDFSTITINEKPKTSSAFPTNLRKHESSFRSGEVKIQKVNSKTNVHGAQNERGFSSGLPSSFSSFSGDQSTFLLDEELELEHGDHSHDDRYSHKR
jgi:la-related protein 1